MIVVVISKERLEELRDATIATLKAKAHPADPATGEDSVSTRAVQFEIHTMIDKIMRAI